jgi:hypothetical protein
MALHRLSITCNELQRGEKISQKDTDNWASGTTLVRKVLCQPATTQVSATDITSKNYTKHAKKLPQRLLITSQTPHSSTAHRTEASDLQCLDKLVTNHIFS